MTTIRLERQDDVRKSSFFGQPDGLKTLFFTEMWERFTYYGMRAVLILFLVGPVAGGGLGLDDRKASAIYGLYISGTYVFALAGGWVADRLVGQRRAVLAGAALILAGNLLLTLGRAPPFFSGLLVVVLGVGLLKPNISAMVAGLYPEGGSRRDAGFSIFYMGISVGALAGSLLVPLGAAYLGWRFAFAIPTGGMAVGILYFLLTRGRLAHADVKVRRGSPLAWAAVAVFLAGLAAVAGGVAAGRLPLDPSALAGSASWLIGLLAIGYFGHLLLFAGLQLEERRRVWVMIVLFAAYAIFYAGFEQGGSSLNLFAERYTERTALGVTVPAGFLQGTTAFYTILLAPVFARLWLALGRRGRDLSASAKFAVGLALLGAGALVMVAAAEIVAGGRRVLPTWLLATYLLQECGDLCLSPVGLSSMTKLAPPKFAGQVLGVWFLAIALGNNISGQLSGEYDAGDLHSLPRLFLQIGGFSLGAALLLGLLAPRLSRLTKGAA